MKPSDFTNQPYNSALQKTEAEIVARNVMVILKRTGNEFRKLTWEEYTEERKKDGNFTESEKQYFDKVIPYCEAPMTARLFSPEWNK